MSVSDCGKHKHKRKKWAKITAIVLTACLVVVLLILILWLALRPSKPSFTLMVATFHAFQLSATTYPNTQQLTCTMELTLQSRNPNSRVGIYYDGLVVYATYSSQRLTTPTSIPPTYQGSNGMSSWSPFVSGVSQPITGYTAGNLPLNIMMNGQLRWRVGSMVFGSYPLAINCPVSIPLAGTPVGNKYQLLQSCIVTV